MKLTPQLVVVVLAQTNFRDNSHENSFALSDIFSLRQSAQGGGSGELLEEIEFIAAGRWEECVMKCAKHRND